MPSFWLGIVLCAIFRVCACACFPSPAAGDGGLDTLWHLTLPALTIALSIAPILVRTLRSSLDEVLDSDYVTTGARPWGSSGGTLLVSYVLRNSLRPVVTVLAINVGILIGGTVIVEQIFSLPGIGSLLIGSITRRDYAVIQLVDPVLRLARGDRQSDCRSGLSRARSARYRSPDDAARVRASVPLRGFRSGRGLLLRLFGRSWTAANRRPGLSRRSSWPRSSRRCSPVRSDRRSIASTGLQPPSERIHSAPTSSAATSSTRVIYAARIDLQIGFIGVADPAADRAWSSGLVAGYSADGLDAVIGRVSTWSIAFPFLVLVIAIVAMLGPGLINFYIAVSLGELGAYARIVRGETLGAQAPGVRRSPRRPRVRRRCGSCSATSCRTSSRRRLVFGMSDFVLDIQLGATLASSGSACSRRPRNGV